MFANKKTQAPKLLLFVLLSITILSKPVKAQKTINADSITCIRISEALNKGNIEALKEVLNRKTDITLPDKSGIYSNRQAYFILKYFFTENPPKSFQIINTSFNNGSNFVVGKMHTTSQHYRVCYLTKEINNKSYIYQIRIEK